MSGVTAMRIVRKHPLRFALPLLWLVESLLLVLANCIPDRLVKSHIAAGMAQLAAEGTYPKPLGAPQSVLDNFTDAIILQESQRTSDWNNTIALLSDPASYAADHAASVHNPLYAAFANQGYARYWHGYTVVTKPLLALFGYQSIRMISFFAAGLLAFAALTAIRREFGSWPAGVLGMGFMAMALPVAPMCMQYWPVMYVTLVSLAGIRMFRDYRRRVLLFLCIGSVINYLDILTAPLLTLGVPLLFCMLYDLRDQPGRGGWRALLGSIRNAVLCSVAWGVAYGLTWAVKWVLSTIVLRRNIIQNAYANIVIRSGSDAFGQQWTKWQTISKNLHVALQAPMTAFYVLFFAVLVVWLAARLVMIHAVAVRPSPRAFARALKGNVMGALPILLVGCYPFVWWAVMQNHSQVHAELFVFKNTAIVLMAAALALTVLFGGVRGQNGEDA